MTVREANELERAIERATREGVEVVAQGRRKDNGQRVFCVPSQSHPGLWHLVTLTRGRYLACDCEAAKHNPNTICVHRAATHMHLTVEADRRREHAREVEIALRLEAGRIEGAHLRGQDPDAPLPIADNRPIGIWK